MPDDTRPEPDRPDLTIMRAQGDTLALDGVVDLLAAAAEHYASVLTNDGGYRAPGDPPPARRDVDHRVAAALDGASAAFTDAAARYRQLAA
ncbi:MAG TPA: hypothetical protein VHB30_06165 [Solirubrobacteraceae bacterium]|nr:hypothetical protein [Solirubrobacteraceae bacterium]